GCRRLCRGRRCVRSCRCRMTNGSCGGRSRCWCSRLRSRRHHCWRRCLGCSRSSRCRCCRCTRLCHGRSGLGRRARFHGTRRNTCLRRRRSCGRFHPCSLRSRFLRFFFCFSSRFRLRFFFGSAQNLFAHLLSDVLRNRARVRLLLRDAIPGQQVNNGFGFDLEFAGQLVDSDLICVGHALRSRLRLRFSRLRWIAFIVGGRCLYRCLRRFLRRRSFLDCLCRLRVFRSLRRLNFRRGLGPGFSQRFLTFCRSFAARGRFACRSRRLGAAFIKPVHRLINLVHHLFADARNFQDRKSTRLN